MDVPENFGNFLQALLDDLGVGPTELASLVERSERTVYNWLKADAPPRDAVVLLSDVFDIPLAALRRAVAGEGSLMPEHRSRRRWKAARAKVVREEAEAERYRGGGQAVQVGEIEVMPYPTFYGLPAFDFDENGEQGAAVTHWPNHGPHAFAAVLRGDCMEPHYPDRCTVLFAPVSPFDGLELRACYYVATEGGGITFKQLVKVDDDSLTFRCSNPSPAAGRPERMTVPRAKVLRMAKAVRVVLPAPRPD